MDPAARRRMWQLILANIKDRSCVLTTHSMDEADALATRIGIMAHGKLRVVGTAEHLKGKFGEGYRLEVVRGDGVAPQDLNALVARAFSEGVRRLDEPIEGRVSYSVRVPQRGLGAVFEEMQRWKRDGVARDAALSQVTLEHVFVDVVRAVEKRTKESEA